MELTFYDLAYKCGTFRTHSEGRGRDKVITPQHGVRCAAGDLPLEEWKRKVEALIAEENEWELYNNLTEWVKRIPWINARDKEAVTREALILHSRRMFDNRKWVDFVKFNQKYRTEVLKDAELVTVVNECCKKPGVITKEIFDDPRIDGGQKINCCPICGRWSPFRLANNDEEEMERLQVSLFEENK